VAKMELVNGVIAQKIVIIEAPAKNTDQCLAWFSWYLRYFGRVLTLF